jgi:nitrogen-specific signal transduction histidine kinase
MRTRFTLRELAAVTPAHSGIALHIATMSVVAHGADRTTSALSPTSTASEILFRGPGEMRALCRAFDWSATSLGPVEQWPNSLRTMVLMMLASRHPMFLWWGPDLVQIYNDAYRPSFESGGRHMRALGAKGAEFWTEIWDIIGPQIAQVMSGGESTWHEDALVPIERNGRIEDVWWTYSYGPAFNDAGEVNGVLVVCHETTSRIRTTQALEEANQKLAVERSRLAYAFQQAPAFLAVLRGPEFTFDFANESFIRLVGHRELMGLPLFDAIPEARDQGFETLLRGVLETGEPYIGRSVPIMLARAADTPPEERILDFVYYPLIEADGSRDGVIAHGVDVTDHVRAMRESESARADAETANRAKSEFLTIMSHELRTPLNAIGGYAELLELGIRGPVTDEMRDDLARIRKSQRHLLGLINDVLNYTRIEASRVKYDIAHVALDEALSTCEALTAPQRRAKNLEFAFEHCGPDIVARADREHLQQIIINLLTNAVKFTQSGGRIALRSGVIGANIVVTVADTGRGIAPNELGRIFEPFVQVDAGLTRTQEGIGLGLAISRDLARGMGGDLTVQSERGVGSTFTLTLPSA